MNEPTKQSTVATIKDGVVKHKTKILGAIAVTSESRALSGE